MRVFLGLLVLMVDTPTGEAMGTWQEESVNAVKNTRVGNKTWTYNDSSSRMDGPRYWAEIYKSCGGQKQSPVELSSRSATAISLPSIIFKDYDQISNKNCQVMNNGGKSVKMSKNKPILATIKGGPLPNEYEWLQLHFHWGSNVHWGAEHIVDGKRYPLEMHLLHRLVSERFPAKVKDGLAVLGFVFDISEEPNEYLEPLIETFPNITNPGDILFAPARPTSLVHLTEPATVGPYFHYSGSLTTPPCPEVAQWIVYKTPLTLSLDQLNRFMVFKNAQDEIITDNYRPLQPLNGRTVLQTDLTDGQYGACFLNT